jgi:hypothetical protein
LEMLTSRSQMDKLRTLVIPVPKGFLLDVIHNGDTCKSRLGCLLFS